MNVSTRGKLKLSNWYCSAQTNTLFRILSNVLLICLFILILVNWRLFAALVIVLISISTTANYVKCGMWNVESATI